MKPLDAITLMQIEEGERKVAAKMLHDTLAQDLSNLSMASEIALRTMDAGGDARSAVHGVREAAIACRASMRLARR